MYLFDEIVGSFIGNRFTNLAFSWYQVTSDKGKVVLAIDLPGCRKEDLSLSFKDKYLTVSGKKNNDAIVNSSVYINVNTDDLEAKFEDCVLTVTFNLNKTPSSNLIPIK